MTLLANGSSARTMSMTLLTRNLFEKGNDEYQTGQDQGELPGSAQGN